MKNKILFWVFVTAKGYKFWSWLAWRLPKRLVYWAAIRLIANATQGKYSNQVVPELKILDALERWEGK
jgi:hypothetical protein